MPSKTLIVISGDNGWPFPRSKITKDFHYIRNFRAKRWPVGDPPAGAMPDFDTLAKNTHAAFPDVDQGPTKAWILTHRDEPKVKAFYERICEKRPEMELYDLRRDPHEMKNLVGDPEYAEVLKKLDPRLMGELEVTGDPRATGGGDDHDRECTICLSTILSGSPRSSTRVRGHVQISDPEIPVFLRLPSSSETLH